ncbi:hypothetical protein KVR01_002212 [Diaporthe batatas]|uniref:uncharacterized protein n=1 Tax=Diaporthe batatas TaxID=748121 RepID=UPI001D047B82|nr:uncharacterized protein KVR01_002212 [Diaporthe batatas]KAG8166523.1 hypothetical protein KVR01_002212 [Diaporthe batatas]
MAPPDRSPASLDSAPLAQPTASTHPSNTQTASIPHPKGGTSGVSPSRAPPVTGRMAGSSHAHTQSNMQRPPPPPPSTRNTLHGNSPRPSTSPSAHHPRRSVQSNHASWTNGARGPRASPHNTSADMRIQQHRQQSQQQRATTDVLAGATLSSAQSLTLDLRGLPKDIKISEIMDTMTAKHLSLTRVDIHENEDGTRTGRARVVIEPTPTRWPTWTGPGDSITITRTDHSTVTVPFEVRPYFLRSIRTPCHGTIPPPFCQKKFPSKKMVFGMMASESAMWNPPQFSYEGVTLVPNFARRRFEVDFKVNVGRYGLKLFRIQVDFSHPGKLIWGPSGNGAWGLAMLLPSPPKLYGRLDVSHDDDQSLWQEWDRWARQTHISGELHKLKELPARLQKPAGQSVDFGRWTTYYFDFDSCLNEWESVRTYLADYNVKIAQVDHFTLVNTGTSNAWKLIDSTEMTLELLDSRNTFHLEFPVRYQLEVCISHGLLDEYSIGAQFLEKLESFDVDRARLILEGVAEANRQFFEPMKIFDEDRFLHYWPNARVPPHATLVRRAVITPTAIYFKTPTVELTNRILRKFSDLNDRFLRVQFTDELAFGKIFSSQDSTKDDNLFTRVHRAMHNGIVIGNRHYKFLAFSNSQFRENGAFFFCDTDHTTCDSIREWMGDFRHIRSVGKFAARMGQCFTTTRQVNGISIPKIRLIHDIEKQTGDRVWNFTDGIGKISFFLATLIANERDLPETPSCFQIRMGGVKGTLVPWPDVPPSEVHVRPSQEKFKAIHNGLEIIKTSAFSHATLNKQVIPILTALGVDKSVFVSILESELRAYKEALSDSMRAGELLRSQVDENQITLTMAEMVDTFMDSKEPFLWTLLRLWKCWVLRRLKDKFAVSIEKSAMVFGIVDEIGVLRGHSRATEGRRDNNIKLLPQIFLQIPVEGSDGRSTTNYEVVTGLCVVGRNPSLHPGDVRVVEAVDAPELRHLKNVVVFPKTGDRDIPSMCSGGDMDGDDYFVFWDERLIPLEWYHPPLDHDAESSTPGVEEPADVTIEDVSKFFVQYMKNDSLGSIASAHVAWADQSSEGVKDPKCIELAKLHSKAVDYVKSGKPAVMQRRLRPRTFPHWMGKERKSTYHSHTALGQMYDQVKVGDFHTAYEMSFNEQILSRYALDEDTLAQAVEIKAAYDTAMRRLIGQHEAPVTEFEMWSTFILSKPRVGSDYKLQENVGRDIAALKDRFRAECKMAVAGKTQTQILSSSVVDLEKLDRFVAAMYTVTYREVRASARERLVAKPDHDSGPEELQMPLISFPWLFHRELARLALGRGGDVRPLKTETEDLALDDGEFGVPGVTASTSNDSMVPDDSTRSSVPASPRTGHRSEDDDKSVDFEEVGDDDQEGDEDALEVLARKVGM